MTRDAFLSRPSRLDSRLSTRQGLALTREVTSARNLLRDSIDAIARMKSVDRHGDAIFSTTSLGVEKMLKVLRGCQEFEVTGIWPSGSRLREWGHNVGRLNSDFWESLPVNWEVGAGSEDLRTLATAVAQSKALPLLFAVLSAYGSAGRYHWLDTLADDGDREDVSPRALWDALEHHVQGEIHGWGERVPMDAEGSDRYSSVIRRAIASELSTWWVCLYRLCAEGYVGGLAASVSVEMWET